MLPILVQSLKILSLRPSLSVQICRSISISSRLYIKEIIEKKEGNTLVLEASLNDSLRHGRILKPQNNHDACPICSSGLDVKHTDVLIISQFVDEEGKLLPRAITKLCKWQQRRMKFIVEMAHRAGLMTGFKPKAEVPVKRSENPLKRPDGWRKFNIYFDESLITPSKFDLRMKKKEKMERALKLALQEEEAYQQRSKENFS